MPGTWHCMPTAERTDGKERSSANSLDNEGAPTRQRHLPWQQSDRYAGAAAARRGGVRSGHIFIRKESRTDVTDLVIISHAWVSGFLLCSSKNARSRLVSQADQTTLDR